jgi:hypothetical protein
MLKGLKIEESISENNIIDKNNFSNKKDTGIRNISWSNHY